MEDAPLYNDNNTQIGFIRINEINDITHIVFQLPINFKDLDNYYIKSSSKYRFNCEFYLRKIEDDYVEKSEYE